jgi:hypothetical protein
LGDAADKVGEEKTGGFPNCGAPRKKKEINSKDLISAFIFQNGK